MKNISGKFNYLIDRIKNIKKPQILELGVKKGVSTKIFLEICEKEKGHLISVDIVDCKDVSNSPNWEFIHSSDDNFKLINNRIKNSLDVIYIDSLHEPSHVKKVFYNYYQFLKIGGLCFIDDISWLPYIANKKKENRYMEETNFRTFNKILEIYNQNKNKFSLEFYFEGSGLAIIRKKDSNLNESKKIISREITFKNLLKYFFKRKPKK